MTNKLTDAERRALLAMPAPNEAPKLIRENVAAERLAKRGLAQPKKLRCISEPLYRLTSAGEKMLKRVGS